MVLLEVPLMHQLNAEWKTNRICIDVTLGTGGRYVLPEHWLWIKVRLTVSVPAIRQCSNV